MRLIEVRDFGRVAKILFASLLFWSTVMWLVVSFLAPSLSAHVPRKHFLTYALALGIALTSGLLLRSVDSELLEAESSFFVGRRRLARILAWIGVIGVASSFVYVVIKLLSAWVAEAESVIGASRTLLCLGTVTVGYTCFRFGRGILAASSEGLGSMLGLRLERPDAEEVLKADLRPPILYLRAFSEEQSRSKTNLWIRSRVRGMMNPWGWYLYSFSGTFQSHARAFRRGLYGSTRPIFDEQIVFGETFDRVGPYIAVGRPGEVFANMDIGAAKKYVADDEWQEQVLSWLKKCAAVVLDAGESQGLRWELEQVVQVLDPRKLLLVLPHDDECYRSFRGVAAEVFPELLPARRPDSRLLMFDQVWKPIELENRNLCLGDTLAPFFAQAGLAPKGLPFQP